VAEEAESLVKKYFDVVGSLQPEVAAVAVLWTAAKATGAPRPLEDFLRCSKDYVKTLAARVDLPASIVKSAVELLERNRRFLSGKNPWVWAAALWLASLKKLGLLKALAEAAGADTVSIRNAAKRMRV
jgi:hypothetical protein